jgi:hypothetical protein
VNRNAMWEACGNKFNCIYMHGKTVWRKVLKHFTGLRKEGRGEVPIRSSEFEFNVLIKRALKNLTNKKPKITNITMKKC